MNNVQQNNDSNSTGKSISNTAARSRRKILRMMGASGGTALGTVLAKGWEKPALESMVLPAHAAMSENEIIPCPISVTITEFYHSPLNQYSVSAIASGSDGVTVLNEFNTNYPSSTFGSTSLSGSSTFPPGNYSVGLSYSLGESFASGEVTYNASCCDASTGPVSSNLALTSVAITEELVISDNGSCQFIDD